jgi:hypothetical protein
MNKDREQWEQLAWSEKLKLKFDRLKNMAEDW